MSNIVKGLIAGTIFGIAATVPMFFMTFEDKTRAITAAFIARFALGFIIFNLELPMPGWIKGAILGFVLSLPDALITKQYAPILGLGVIGGIICGIISK
jgi:hypothetical protein